MTRTRFPGFSAQQCLETRHDAGRYGGRTRADGGSGRAVVPAWGCQCWQYPCWQGPDGSVRECTDCECWGGP